MDGQTNNDVALIELVFMIHLQLQRKSRKKTFGTRKTMSIKKKRNILKFGKLCFLGNIFCLVELGFFCMERRKRCGNTQLHN